MMSGPAKSDAITSEFAINVIPSKKHPIRLGKIDTYQTTSITERAILRSDAAGYNERIEIN